MILEKLRHIATGSVTLAAFGLLIGACTYNDAQVHCQHEGGFSGDALNACVFGATQVGPSYSNIVDADAECNCRYPVREDLNADGHCNRYARDDRHPMLAPITFRGNSNWADQTNERINLYNGCHAGAASHLIYSGSQDAGTVNSSGCIQTMDAGSGNVTCRPGGGGYGGSPGW